VSKQDRYMVATWKLQVLVSSWHSSNANARFVWNHL